MANTQRTTLRDIRVKTLDATLEDIIRSVRGISMSTYGKAEAGKRVTYGTAKKIVEAFNTIAKEKGIEEVYTLDDLDLNLY